MMLRIVGQNEEAVKDRSSRELKTPGVVGVFLLVDPLDKHPHDPDIQAVQRVCNVHDVPLATNLATANLIISAGTV